MLNTLRRLLSRRASSPQQALMEAWALERGHQFRRVRGGAPGCVIEGRQGTQPWRLEWGASQRCYIPGLELRQSAEFELPRELQVLLLNRPLLEATEREVYEHFVDTVQTRADAQTPPEMRWLMMFDAIGGQRLGPLRARYGAVASAPAWLLQWLASPLTDALAATITAAPAEQPVVLVVGRGRLMLRTAMAEPDERQLLLWHTVFEHALRAALRIGDEWRDRSAAASTPPSLWPNSAAPADELPA